MEGRIAETHFEEAKYYSDGWKYGPPRGIMFHFSEFSADRRVQLADRGASVHFTVYSDPVAYKTLQHVNLLNRSWHALEASDYYFGIEHTVYTQNIHFEDAQLEESARISAEIIAFAKQKWGITIPLVRAPGAGFSPGFKDHKDGIGTSWNTALHSDGLVKNWSWAKYIEKVKTHLQEDDMAIFESKEDFRDEILKALVGFDREGNPNVSQDQYLNAVRFTLGLDLRMKGDQRPSKSDSTQKGWDLADKVMKSSGEDLAREFPKGRLSGIISFESKD